VRKVASGDRHSWNPAPTHGRACCRQIARYNRQVINSAVTAEVIRSSHLFADVPCELIDALSAIAVLVEKPANCLLFHEGDPVPGLYVTLTGHIKVSRIAQNGREQVVMVSSLGQSVNLVPVFDGGVCPANVETIEDARLSLCRKSGHNNTFQVSRWHERSTHKSSKKKPSS